METRVEQSATYTTQAERIIARFGGARKLSRMLSDIGRPRTPATIYRWTYPDNRGGTNGLIPTSAWPDLFVAARAFGVILTPEDMDPRPLKLRGMNAIPC